MPIKSNSYIDEYEHIASEISFFESTSRCFCWDNVQPDHAPENHSAYD